MGGMIRDYLGDLWRIVSHFIRLSRCMCWKIFNFPLSVNMYVKNVRVSVGSESAFVDLNFIRLFKISCFSSDAFRYKRFTHGDIKLPFLLVKLSCCFVNWFYCYWTFCYFTWLFQKRYNFGRRSYPLSDFQLMTNKHISERLNLL